jgi:lipoprotein-releasing system ATP-binding protein
MNDHAEKSAVRCEGLRKTYRSQAEDLHVLEALDFELAQGLSCSIMGASGSGKSTFLSILGGLERLDGGTAFVGGHALHALKETELPGFRACTVGFVFQFHYLLKDFTAIENVALPAWMNGMEKSLAWKKAARLLEIMGMGSRQQHFPSQLSGGERQRAAIARALVNDPDLLLADEPTGNLDAANAASIRDLLYSLPAESGTTLILATHDAALADMADRRYLLSGGRLAGR